MRYVRTATATATATSGCANDINNLACISVNMD
jgi:hypothetical protein